MRAIAVLPVIFFHAGFELFKGGFVGVDVFFVISGYLITSTILADKEAGTFTLTSFYERRARRILPALFFVMLVCLPFAWRWMLPDYFENFGQSVVATVFFSNNVLLAKTTGYFDLESEFKPLLHTWSLGVEEQYYAVFPLFFLSLCRLGRRGLIAVTLFTTLVSFGIAQSSTAGTGTRAFYLIQTRAWELLIGVLAALFQARRDRTPAGSGQPAGPVMSCLGLFLILYSVFSFEKGVQHPEWHMLLPTLGTAFIVYYATGEGLAGRLLGAPWLVGIGLLSYSAYLWHQPLFAFARVRSLTEPSGMAMSGLALLAVALAYPTWRYIEMPFRDKSAVSRKALLLAAVLTGLLLSSTGFAIYANSGFVHARPELNLEMKAAGRRLNAIYNEHPFKYKGVQFADPAKLKVLVLGNSLARDFINSGLENGFFGSCEISYSDRTPACLRSENDIPESLRELIANCDYMIFGSPSISRRCWSEDFKILKVIGAKRIVVIGPKNFGWNMNAVMLLPADARQSYRAEILRDVLNSNEQLERLLSEEYFVNLIGLISDGHGRIPVFTEDGMLISQDRVHLTKAGAKYVGKRLFEHPLLVPLK